MKSGKLSANKKVFLLLCAIVVLGFALRLYHLGKPSLWYDELYTAGRSLYQPTQILADLRENPFPPLYYIGMHYWIRLFGDSEFSLRFPSVLCSLLTIIFVFMLSKELFGEKVGIFSALFSSVSAYSIYYAQEAKMYSLLWLFGTLSFLFFHRFIKEDKKTHLPLYVLFTSISTYIMYVGFIFVIIQNIVFFTLFRGKRTKKWLFGQSVIILLYLPWLGRFLYHATHKSSIYVVPKGYSYAQIFEPVFSKTLCGPVPRNDIMELAIYSFLILTAFLSLVPGKPRRLTLDFKRNDFLLSLWVALPFGIYWLINTFLRPILFKHTERYIGFIYIPLFILAGKGLNKYGPKVKYTLLIFLLFSALSFGVLPLYDYNYRVIHREDWRGFSQELLRRAEPGSLVLTDIPQYMLPYYVKDHPVRPLSYIDLLYKQPADKRPPSIFVVYTFLINANCATLRDRLKEYRIVEDYYEYPSGFLWFKKNDPAGNPALKSSCPPGIRTPIN